MATDFSALLKAPAGKAQKPQALPVANYPGMITKFSLDVSSQRKTPFVRFTIKLTGWPDDVDESDRKQQDGTPIDLSKREQRFDFYLTPNVLWRLDEALKEFGVETEGRSYEETIPEMVGKQLIADVQQRMVEGTSDAVNEIKKIAPLD